MLKLYGSTTYTARRTPLAEQQNADFGELALRLVAFARRTFADFGLPRPGATVSGVGLSMEDFVWGVLEEYVEGRLEHEASRGDLFSLLATAMRNDIIDSLRKAAHSHEETRSTLPREPDSITDPPSLDEMPSAAIDVPALLDEENYRKRVWASLGGEPELAEVVRAILDLNLYKPREIAAALGISVTEVQNRKKRLRRRFIESNLVQGKIS
jgi:DNA-directed RNA polymerase specialized sigma24 family protein